MSKTSQISRVALTDLAITPDGSCETVDKAVGFDTMVYSRIKYGSKKFAEQYGQLLGSKLLEAHYAQLLAEQAPVAVVIYQVVPPACHALSHAAMERINQARLAAGLQPGSVVRVHKGEMLAQEYAAEPIEVRQKILEGITFDTLDHNFTNKTVLFLDDVRITGTTEKKVCSTIQPHDPAGIICGYIAQFDEAQARRDPQIETRMNSTYVRSLSEIADIINEDGFVLNIRVLKRILRSDERAHLERFLKQIPLSVCTEVVSAARASGLSNHPDFRDSYLYIVEQVSLPKIT